MGNKESNDDFSKSSSFNMQKHQEAMAQLNANYTHQNINLDVGYGPIIKPQVTQAEFKAIHRTCSIYKPSINITSQNASTLKIEFEYDSDQGNKLQIHMGVHKVEQDLQSHITQHIDSEIYYQTLLAAGKKVRFQNAYSIQKLSKIVGCTIILRMLSQTSTEITEYSIKNVGQNHWKTLLQKLQINGLVTQLDNIYRGGGQSDDCIICFCQKVNTIIQPCNHLCLCSACSEEVRKTTNICPICRTPIKSFKRIKTTMQ